MNKKLLIAPAAVAAVLLFAGCTPSTTSEDVPTPDDMMSSMPEASPSETMPTDMGGTETPTAEELDPNITLSGDGSPSLPADFPAGIPVYAMNIVPDSGKGVDGGGYEVAFSGAAEDVVTLLDAFKVNGFTVSGTDTSIMASNQAYNIVINSDPADLPTGAAYEYTIFSN